MEPETAVRATAPPEEGLHLRRYLRVLAERKWWFGGCVALSLLIAFVYNTVQTPIYEGRTTLLVDTGTRSRRSEDDILWSLTGVGRARTLGTQIEIVQSPTRVTNAARIVAARQIVETATEASAAQETGTKADAEEPAVELPEDLVKGKEGAAFLQIVAGLRDAGIPERNLEKLLVSCSYARLKPGEGDGFYPPGVDLLRAHCRGDLEDDKDTLEERERKLTSLCRELEIADLADPSASLLTDDQCAVLSDGAQRWVSMPPDSYTVANECRRRLLRYSVQAVRDTDVIAITCQSASPRLAAWYSTAIEQEYEWHNLLSNREVAKKGADWVTKQKGIAQGELDKKAAQLRNLLSASGLASVSDAASAATERVHALSDRVAEAEANVEAGEAQLAMLGKQLTRQQQAVVTSKTVTSSPIVSQLRASLLDAQRERASLLEKVTERHSSVAELDARIDKLEAQLSDELRKTVTSETQVTNPLGEDLLNQVTQSQAKVISDQAHLDALNGALTQARAELARIPDIEQRAAQLQRETQTAEKNYLALEDTYQSLTLAQATEMAGASILDRAGVPQTPVSPNKRLNLMMGFLLGFIGGLALALLIDFLDNTVKDLEEFERLYHLPVLGVIPRVRTPHTALLGSEDPAGASAEPYRSLRSNLRFAIAAEAAKCLLIASPGPGEGKTTTAANLAIVCGEMGDQIILVDTDLRRPSVASQMGLAPEIGVTTCIVGDKPLDEALQTTGHPGVRVLTSGPTPPNALQILEGPRMSKMVADLREAADLVVLDSPPAAILADAQALAVLADGIVLVIEMGKTKRPMLQRALDVLGRTGTRCLGVVVNKAIPHKGGYGYYYYHYDYYHDYYGYTGAKKESQGS